MIGLAATASIVDVLDARAGWRQSMICNLINSRLWVFTRGKKLDQWQMSVTSVTLVFQVFLGAIKTGVQVKTLLIHLQEVRII